ncbi:MAG TPA: aquaporin [Firmicutes bacterium]|nr:aquaporin [Bacillota bacterium]
MQNFIAELIGTLFLVLFGEGVIANVKLKKTTGNNGGIIAITAGWAFGITLPVLIFGKISQAHLNPAVTLALAAIGKFSWESVPSYLIAQFIGAFLGSVIVFIIYYNHFKATSDAVAKSAVFCTAPQIEGLGISFITELVGTFLLMFIILALGDTALAGGIKAIAIGMLVWAIGLSIGGPTGYAINPARDLGPRVALQLLPVPGKGKVDWSYAIVPVVAPIVGALAAALLYINLF